MASIEARWEGLGYNDHARANSLLKHYEVDNLGGMAVEQLEAYDAYLDKHPRCARCGVAISEKDEAICAKHEQFADGPYCTVCRKSILAGNAVRETLAEKLTV